MIMQVCAIYDKKVGAYMLPQFFRTKGEAMRAFLDACAQESAPFKRHAEDYYFCRLGEYDDVAGRVECVATPEILLTALDGVLRNEEGSVLESDDEMLRRTRRVAS